MPIRAIAGDTLASALLANGVHLVGRSFKYHRPRGLFAAGAEEPNALVTVGRDAARITPNLRATQVELYDGLERAQPESLAEPAHSTVGAINDVLSPFFPAGFYYKTFMWPRGAWKALYEPVIRARRRPGTSAHASRSGSLRTALCALRRTRRGRGPCRARCGAHGGRCAARASCCATNKREFGGSLLVGSRRAGIDGKHSAERWLDERRSRS